jgi:hypothetical protein
MARRSGKVFKALKLSLNSIEDPELKSELKGMFTSYQINRELAVEKSRTAAKAKSESDIQTAQAHISLLTFLAKAGDHFDQIRREAQWLAYSKGDDVIIENPFSEQDIRNLMNVERASLQQRAEGLQENSDDGDLYEDEEGA